MRPIKPVIPTLRCSSVVLSFTLCSMLLLITGCASIQQKPWQWVFKEKPTLALSDIELQEIKALETIFVLKLRIINPDDTSMEIRSLKCELKINDELFASGISDERKGLPAFGTITMPVVVYTSKFTIVGSVIEMLQKDVQHYGTPSEPLSYELTGQLHFGKDGKGILPFQVKGEISLNR